MSDPVPVFEDLVNDLGDRSAVVRAHAAAGLGRLRDARGVALLVGALDDPRVSVRRAALNGLRTMGKLAYPAILERYRWSKGSHRLELLGVLARFKTPAVRELLLAAVDDPDPDVGLEAVRRLGRRRDFGAVERLLAVVARSAQALDAASLRPGPSGQAPEHWGREAMRLRTAVHALAEAGDPRAFDPLQALLRSGRPWLQAGFVPDLVRALRRIDNPRAVDLIHDSLDDGEDPLGSRFDLTIAGMDLMNAAESLRPAAGSPNAGSLTLIFQAINAVGEALRQALPGTNAEAAGRVRQVEESLLTLGRGSRKPEGG
ncbi:MAG: HEAT repeat domain-containing protein [Isosphaeraceae bacterium]